MSIKVGDYVMIREDSPLYYQMKYWSLTFGLYKGERTSSGWLGIKFGDFYAYYKEEHLVAIHPTLVKLWQLDKLFENDV